VWARAKSTFSAERFISLGILLLLRAHVWIRKNINSKNVRCLFQMITFGAKCTTKMRSRLLEKIYLIMNNGCLRPETSSCLRFGYLEDRIRSAVENTYFSNSGYYRFDKKRINRHIKLSRSELVYHYYTFNRKLYLSIIARRMLSVELDRLFVLC